VLIVKNKIKNENKKEIKIVEIKNIKMKN